MNIRRAVAPLSVVVVLMLAACGDDSDGTGDNPGAATTGSGSSSGAETGSFVASAEEYCPQFAELADLGDVLQDSSDLQAAAEATRKYATKAEQLAGDLADLTPPADALAAWTRFTNALLESARAQGAVIEAVDSGNAEELGQLEQEISRSQDEFIAAGQGLKDAGIAPSCLG